MIKNASLRVVIHFEQKNVRVNLQLISLYWETFVLKVFNYVYFHLTCWCFWRKCQFFCTVGLPRQVVLSASCAWRAEATVERGGCFHCNKKNCTRIYNYSKCFEFWIKKYVSFGATTTNFISLKRFSPRCIFWQRIFPHLSDIFFFKKRFNNEVKCVDKVTDKSHDIFFYLL